MEAMAAIRKHPEDLPIDILRETDGAQGIVITITTIASGVELPWLKRITELGEGLKRGIIKPRSEAPLMNSCCRSCSCSCSCYCSSSSSNTNTSKG